MAFPWLAGQGCLTPEPQVRLKDSGLAGTRPPAVNIPLRARQAQLAVFVGMVPRPSQPRSGVSGQLGTSCGAEAQPLLLL